MLTCSLDRLRYLDLGNGYLLTNLALGLVGYCYRIDGSWTALLMLFSFSHGLFVFGMMVIHCGTKRCKVLVQRCIKIYFICVVSITSIEKYKPLHLLLE